MGKEQELLHAVHTKNVVLVQKLLSKYCLKNKNKKLNLNYQDPEGRTILHHAVYSGQAPIVHLMLDHVIVKSTGGNIISNSTNTTAIAPGGGGVGLTTTLSSSTSSSSSTSNSTTTTTIGLCPDVVDCRGRRPIHFASASHAPHAVEVMERLLALGCSGRQPDCEGITPLHVASANRLHGTSLVKLLLHSCVDAIVYNHHGLTPLDIACDVGNVGVVDRLLALDSVKQFIRSISHMPARSKGRSLTSCLHMASANGHLDVLRLIFSRVPYVNINHTTLQGTCLHVAALSGQWNVVVYLLQCGLDASVVNSREQTAADLINTNQPGGRDMKILLTEFCSATHVRAIKDFNGAADMSFEGIPTKCSSSASTPPFAHRISFREGTDLTVLDRSPTGWWKGFVTTEGLMRTGFFPASFVVPLTPPVNSNSNSSSASTSTPSHHRNPPPPSASSTAVVVPPSLLPLHATRPSQSTTTGQAQPPPAAALPCSSAQVYPQNSPDSAVVDCSSSSTLGGTSSVDFVGVGVSGESSSTSNRNSSSADSVDSGRGSAHALQQMMLFNVPPNLPSPTSSLLIPDTSRQTAWLGEGVVSYVGVGGIAFNTSGGVLGCGGVGDHTTVSSTSSGSSHSGSCTSLGRSSLASDEIHAASIAMPIPREIALTTTPQQQEQRLCQLLNELQLDAYAPCFQLAGYADDLNIITRMTPEDLTAIGVTHPRHRKLIKCSVAMLQWPDNLPTTWPGNLMDWLKQLNLCQYHDVLIGQKFVNPEQLGRLTWEDMEEIGIVKLGHQKKLLLAVERLRRHQDTTTATTTANPPVNQHDYPHHYQHSTTTSPHLHHHQQQDHFNEDGGGGSSIMSMHYQQQQCVIDVNPTLPPLSLCSPAIARRDHQVIVRTHQSRETSSPSTPSRHHPNTSQSLHRPPPMPPPRGCSISTRTSSVTASPVRKVSGSHHPSGNASNPPITTSGGVDAMGRSNGQQHHQHHRTVYENMSENKFSIMPLPPPPHDSLHHHHHHHQQQQHHGLDDLSRVSSSDNSPYSTVSRTGDLNSSHAIPFANENCGTIRLNCVASAGGGGGGGGLNRRLLPHEMISNLSSTNNTNLSTSATTSSARNSPKQQPQQHSTTPTTTTGNLTEKRFVLPHLPYDTSEGFYRRASLDRPTTTDTISSSSLSTSTTSPTPTPPGVGGGGPTQQQLHMNLRSRVAARVRLPNLEDDSSSTTSGEFDGIRDALDDLRGSLDSNFGLLKTQRP